MSKPNTEALDMLIGLTQEALDAATRTLADERRTQQQVQQQISTLNFYQQEYRQRLQQAMQAGISPSSFTNYRAFLLSLDQSIDRAQRTLVAQQQQVDHSQSLWQEQYRKRNAYNTLVDRRVMAAQRAEQRVEQRASDETSSQMHLRQVRAGAHSL